MISHRRLLQRLVGRISSALLGVVCATGAPAATAPEALTLRLSLVDRPSQHAAQQQTLDAGAVAANRGSRRREVLIRARVALRLDGAGSSARTFVAITQDFPGSAIRVDDRLVGLAPRLLNPAQRIGSTVVHQVEMSIGPDVPPGAFLSSLIWTAETD